MQRLCLLLVLVASCSKHEDSKPAPTPEPKPVAAAPANVAIFVDDQQVGSATPQQVATWPRLDTLVPANAARLGKWNVVYLKGASPKPSEVQHPSATYPELVPALFPGDDGKPSFGMFDPVELAKHGKPQLREDAIHEVRIKLDQDSGRGEHEQGQGGGADPTTIEVTVKTKKGESKVTGKQLLDVPRSPFPGETGEGRGWPLQTVLDLAGVKTFDRLLLTDAAGLNLNLDKSDFTKTSIPFLKLNRQGSLRLRIFKKKGETWEQSGDLRGLASVEVVK